MHKGKGLPSTVHPCPGHVAWGWEAFWVQLGMALGQAGSRSKCPVSWVVLKDGAGKDTATRWVRVPGQGWEQQWAVCGAGLGRRHGTIMQMKQHQGSARHTRHWTYSS